MSFTFTCPHCGSNIEAEEEWRGMEAPCPSCQQNVVIHAEEKIKLTLVKTGQDDSAHYSTDNGQTQDSSNFNVPPPNQHTNQGIMVSHMGNGKFSITGSYASIWQCVLQVLRECEYTINENNPYTGTIVGKCKYGLNAFGITGTAIFYINGNSITLEFSAHLSDAFDTMKVCTKKVNLFSERLMGLASVFSASPIEQNFPQRPPAFTERAGESYVGSAKVAFYMGLIGLFIGLFGILAIIFGCKALSGMSISHNEEGKGFAVAAVILGAIDCVFMLIVFLTIVNLK